MHAGTAIHDDIAFVADRIARRIALGEQRGDRVAPTQVATLAYPADFVVLAAAGPEFGEVHLAGEDPLLLGGQAGEERLGLFRVAGEAEALVQPLGQLAFVGPDHLARLLGQRGAGLRQVGRIQVALEEGLIVGPRRAGLEHDIGTRPAVARHHRAETGDRCAVLHEDVAPGADLQGTGAGDVEVAVEDVAAGLDQREVVGVVVDEEVAGERGIRTDLTGSADTLSQWGSGGNDVAPGAHPDGTRTFIPGLPGAVPRLLAETNLRTAIEPDDISCQRIETRRLQIARQARSAIGAEVEQRQSANDGRIPVRTAVAGYRVEQRGIGVAGKCRRPDRWQVRRIGT